MKILFKIADFGLSISNLKNRNVLSYSFLITFLLLLSDILSAQVFSEADVTICNSKFRLAVDRNLADKPIGDVIAEIGKSFIGTDYLANGLEKDGDEQLVINLTGLDCTTFLENSLVLARCIKLEKTSFNEYEKELQLIRYRDGIIGGYTSRLHYFSDWIYDNVKKGIVEDITEDIGGKYIKFNINYMSTHPENYKQLKENPDLIPIIEQQEKKISCREYHYIPKTHVKEELIINGDFIAITTTVEGLDIGHVGIAVKKEDERIYLLNAPNVNTDVQISEEPLVEYLMKYKRHSGVIILRAIDI